VRKDDPQGQIYAAKLFRYGFHDDGNHEISIMKVLHHPRVSNMIDSYPGDESSSAVIVMVIIKGNVLREGAKKLRKSGKSLPEQKAMVINWFR